MEYIITYKMTQLLDDYKYREKPKAPKPNNLFGLISILIFGSLLTYQFTTYGTSETALVQGSYVWMPFLILSLAGFILPPKRAIILAILTVPVTYFFYLVIWPGL
jgi:hypothetical protein